MNPQDLTPYFNSIPMERRIYASVLEKYPISLDGSNPSSVTFPIDVSVVKIVNKSNHIAYFNVSYTDGSNEYPGDLTASTTNKRVHEISPNGTFDLIQEEKFNTVHAVSASVVELVAFPGKGFVNGLSS